MSCGGMGSFSFQFGKFYFLKIEAKGTKQYLLNVSGEYLIFIYFPHF